MKEDSNLSEENELRKKLREAIQELDLVRAELSEAREIVHSMFAEACETDFDETTGLARYDHDEIPAFQYAQSKLLDWNMLSIIECVKET